jgi:hypothetical protein
VQAEIVAETQRQIILIDYFKPWWSFLIPLQKISLKTAAPTAKIYRDKRI